MVKIITLLALTILSSNAYGAHKHHKTYTPKRHKPYEKVQFTPTHEALILQNLEINRMGLNRIQDDKELSILVSKGDLVPLNQTKAVNISPQLPKNRRYCMPWTKDFLDDLGEAFYAHFHVPILVDSAVRSRKTQAVLRLRNRNAAPIEGDTASSHMAGATIDIARKRMTKEQTLFVEQWLLPYNEFGLIIVEEESGQYCFHIMVMKEYEFLKDFLI